MIRAKGLDLTAFGLGAFEFYDEATEAKITELNNSLIDIKMLGWSVPAECPIQNSVSGNQFIQRVGRVDLGTLNWVYNSSYQYFSAEVEPLIKRTGSANDVANMYSSQLNVVPQAKWQTANKNICYFYTGSTDTHSIILVNYTSLTDATAFKNAMQGVYLYYELATPITMTIDGNEAVEQVNNRVQSGRVKSNGSTITTVQFEKPFKNPPMVTMTPFNASSPLGYLRTCIITNVTETEFSFYEVAFSFTTKEYVAGTDICYWIAAEQ